MKNILLIDDDLDHLAVLAVALIEAGYQVINEIDAESAVAVLRDDVTIDLIIIDDQIPGLDPLSFLTMIRKIMPKVPVIIPTQRRHKSFVKDRGNVSSSISLIIIFISPPFPERTRESGVLSPNPLDFQTRSSIDTWS